MFSYPSILKYILGAQKNPLIETVLLNTHNVCLGWEIRKLVFRYALLTISPVYIFSSRMPSRKGGTDDRGWSEGALSEVKRNIPQSANIAGTGSPFKNMWYEHVIQAIYFSWD